MIYIFGVLPVGSQNFKNISRSAPKNIHDDAWNNVLKAQENQKKHYDAKHNAILH